MYSLVVSGSDASSIVLITSTNGTCATTALNRSGRMLTTAPISRPPALPPWITSRSGDGVLVLDQVLGAVDEVVERVHLLHHAALLAPLLAELAAAADVGDARRSTPRSSRLRRFDENVGASEAPYEP